MVEVGYIWTLDEYSAGVSSNSRDALRPSQRQKESRSFGLLRTHHIMAPSIAQEAIPEPQIHVKQAFDEVTHQGVRSHGPLSTFTPNKRLLTVPKYKYASYLPVYDNTTVFPATEPFEFTDKGTLADKAKPHLFNTSNPSVSVTKLTPRVGTEIKGLQLSQLSDAQKNELALLIAERGVVVFRGQDFKEIGAQKQKEFGEYFGKVARPRKSSSPTQFPFFFRLLARGARC